MNDSLDFSQYDGNADGVVDLVIVAQTEFKFHVADTIFECVHKVILSE